MTSTAALHRCSRRLRTCSDASMSVALPHAPVRAPARQPRHRCATATMPDEAASPHSPWLRCSTLQAAPPPPLPPPPKQAGKALAAAVVLAGAK